MIATLFKSLLPVLAVATACAAEVRTVSARVVYFQDSPDNPKELFFPSEEAEGGFARCAPSNSVSGAPVALPVGSGGAVAFSRAAAAGQVAATATIPNGVSRAILLLLRTSAKGAAPAYQVFLVDESETAFPKGGCYVGNLSPRNVRVSLGEFNYQLPAGKTVAIKQPKRNAYNMAPLKLQMEKGSEWAQVKDTQLRFADNERYLVLTYLDAEAPASKIYKQTLTAPLPAPAP